MASKQLSTDEVVELILDDDFDFSEGDSSDEEGGGCMPTLVNSILTQQRLLLIVEALQPHLCLSLPLDFSLIRKMTQLQTITLLSVQRI